MTSIPPIHSAVVTPATRARLAIKQLPTIPPTKGEVLVRNDWTASTPLDLHQADGGLLVKHPQVLGDGIAGQVVQVGDGVEKLKVGDMVFGFAWRAEKEKAHQEYVTAPEYLFGKIPAGFTHQEAVTVPNNFVTVFNTMTADLQLPMPWPKPADYVPEHANAPFLIWGGSSSVGQYALQILKYYGYRNLFTTASTKHHSMLKQMGAAQVFDYRNRDAVEAIRAAAASSAANKTPSVPFVIDCIGSRASSLAPIAEMAQPGSAVAVLLPVVIKDASETEAPEYSMDPAVDASWAPGVRVSGVRTHFYLNNEFLKKYLQTTIMPALLAQGVIRPNAQRVVEGETLLERAQKALDILRRKEVSGERLVWRVAS